ncbi:MAG TPA: metal ABC transporter permease [Myxococcota bacterium]|nr:metal ABC transporter permease [Myxococcota bacterium]HQK50596.1 metal ABC transporter permease [Myxococcota bacterium]
MGWWMDPTVQVLAAGACLMGALAGTVGTLLLLRRQSLLGDAVSHAALPGIVLAFWWTGSRETPVLLAGAAAAGILGTLWTSWLLQTTRLSEDTALGLLLAVFFGLGIALLSRVQQTADARQAGLDRFLFGQAAGMRPGDLAWMAGGLLSVGALLGLFWKEWKQVLFDREYATTQGVPVRLLDLLLNGMAVGVVVLGIQSVGVVLMSAMLVAPAAGARQWTDRFGGMMVLAAMFGVLGSLAGTLVSAAVEHVPTGPASVIGVTCIAAASLLLAPRHGILPAWWRGRVGIRGPASPEALLQDFLALARAHGDRPAWHPREVFRLMAPGEARLEDALRTLENRGWVRRDSEGRLALTEEGLRQAAEEEEPS